MKLVKTGSHIVAVLPVLVLAVLHAASAKRDKTTYCGACIALIEEVNHGIDMVNPKEKLQVGSFRVDPSGNQGLYEVPLARSDLHLTELFETVCNKMKDYKETKEGKITFIRTIGRDGSRISTKNVNWVGKRADLLKFACETLIEDHEDTLMQMFKNNESEMMQKVCIEMTGMCTKEDIQQQKEAQDEAIMEGIKEEADRKKQEEGDDDDDDEDDDEEEDEEEDAEEKKEEETAQEAQPEEKEEL